MNKKINVSFLFGAGAEASYGMPMGQDYFKKSVFPQNFNDTIGKALKDNFHSTEYIADYRIPTIKIFKEWVYVSSINNLNFFKDYSSVIKGILDDSDFKDIIFVHKLDESYYKDLMSYNQTDVLKKEFEEYLKQDKDVTIDFLQKLIDEMSKNSIGISNILDSYFHTIINPAKYGKVKFSRIVNYYWSCFFTIVESIFQQNKERLCEYSDSAGCLDYDSVVLNISSFINSIYKITDKNIHKDSYYRYIHELFSANNEIKLIGCATTNYYNYVKATNCDNIIYLNGRLCDFEIPSELKVVNALESKINTGTVFFPFIFGQSLTKPIINSKQVESFYEFKELLKKSDYLVILGYNLNSDDNHINSFIREFVENDKSLIILINRDDNPEDILKKKLNSLMLPNDFRDKIIIVQGDYSKKQTCILNILEKIKDYKNS